jgi:ribulose-phosphate 3-epimerase
LFFGRVPNSSPLFVVALASVIGNSSDLFARQGLQARLASQAPVVLPSLLRCDFGRLAEEIRAVEQAGVKALHLDVMDGHFVPNLTYGPTIVEAARKATELPLDCHLMISDPAKYVRDFRAAGADSMTIHIEAVPNPAPLLDHIREMGALAGLAINPGTPLDAITCCLDHCDIVLVMSVQPGFGGQKFQSVALDKLRRLRELVPPGVLLQVDGGVNASTIKSCAEAGAKLFVVGSAIFGESDYGASVHRLDQLAQIQKE